MNQLRILYFLFAILFFSSCSTTKKMGEPLDYDPPGSTNTKTKPIKTQTKGQFTLGTVTIDNEFAGARMNGFSQMNDSLFQVVISPENQPINLSPWYAFKLSSTVEKDIYLHLKYTFGKHRYYPDISSDGIGWQPIDSSRYALHGTDSAVLKLTVGTKHLWVSAQEILTTTDNDQWINSVLENDYVTPFTYGSSREGEILKGFKISTKEKQPTLIVISRQHPPEVTGYMAMKAFVEELLSESELSKRFRSEFSIMIVPMMNPDGVNNGHWRHNTGGVDLNRDWQFYNQPEIDQFQKFIHQEVDDRKLKVVLGLDFHSTHNDLLYTFNNETYPEKKGVVKQWIRDLRESFPNETITEEDGGSASPVSKNWFLKEFGAESVTYEVGDDTPRKHLKLKGSTSAQLLMELLLKKYSN